MTAPQPKIAVIEDDVAIRQMYHSKLEIEGYQVETAADGKTGLELIKTFHPDLILLDLMMPNMIGLEMLSELKRHQDFDKLKVIVLTNIEDDKTKQAMLNLGANDFIVKADATPAEVSQRIKTVLAAKHTET